MQKRIESKQLQLFVRGLRAERCPLLPHQFFFDIGEERRGIELAKAATPIPLQRAAEDQPT